MKPHTPPTDAGLRAGGHDIHHRTADIPKGSAVRVAKQQRHAARQFGRAFVDRSLREHNPDPL